MVGIRSLVRQTRTYLESVLGRNRCNDMTRETESEIKALRERTDRVEQTLEILLDQIEMER